MSTFNQTDLAKFAGLVAKIWNDEELHWNYRTTPHKILGDYGINLPPGVPAPVIPPRPAGTATTRADGRAIGAAFKNVTFENWDLTIEKLTDDANRGTDPAGLKIASLACIACPYSCFSSLSD